MGPSQESPEGKEKVSSEASRGYRSPQESCRAALREGANVHITEKEVPKVQEGFSRADASREGRFRNSPLEYRRGRWDGC